MSCSLQRVRPGDLLEFLSTQKILWFWGDIIFSHFRAKHYWSHCMPTKMKSSLVKVEAGIQESSKEVKQIDANLARTEMYLRECSWWNILSSCSKWDDSARHLNEIVELAGYSECGSQVKGLRILDYLKRLIILNPHQVNFFYWNTQDPWHLIL